jgi:hypothetical protein
VDLAILWDLRKMATRSIPLSQSDKSGLRKGVGHSGNEKFPLKGRSSLGDQGGEEQELFIRLLRNLFYYHPERSKESKTS